MGWSLQEAVLGPANRLATGYLGAGKTTLLQHILKAYNTKKIAVILNGKQHYNIFKTIYKMNADTDE